MTKGKGRKKGVPNLKKTDRGTLINKKGVEITVEEKKHLESLVNSINRKRKRMTEKEKQLFRTADNATTKQTLGEVQRFGQESDFILQPKSKSIQRFESRKEFDTYMRNLERVNQKDYVKKRAQQYKRNHLKAIENTFGKKNELYMRIRMLPLNEYVDKVASDIDFLQIAYVYSEEEKEHRYNQILESIKKKLDKRVNLIGN